MCSLHHARSRYLSNELKSSSTYPAFDTSLPSAFSRRCLGLGPHYASQYAQNPVAEVQSSRNIFDSFLIQLGSDCSHDDGSIGSVHWSTSAETLVKGSIMLRDTLWKTCIF